MVAPGIFTNWQRLSTKIVAVLFSFLVVALLVIGSTLFLSWQLEGSAAAINVTGSLRMHSYRLSMVLNGLENGSHRSDTVTEARHQVLIIDQTLNQLEQGDPQRPLFLPPAGSIRRSFEQVTQLWQGRLKPAALELLQQPDLTAAETGTFQLQAEQFAMQVDGLVQLIERDSEQRTFWLRASQLMLLALALVGTVCIVYLLFDLIVAPVTRMQMGMESMRERDFGVRLPVESDDEFGKLAEGFNQMADRLQGLYGNLEQLVQSKTAALESQNRELALLYDSAAFLQQPQPAESLCNGFMKRISEYFDADGGSVRILDPIRANLHMLVHHGLSEQLVESEQCLKVGDCLCGEAVAKKIAVVHDLRRIDEGHSLKCHREGFVTVSVFHIYAQRQHLGFFNLHFRKPVSFNQRETALLETLGQLLGTAIENQRLAAREREMAISEERNLVAQGLHDSIAQGLNFLNLQVQMLDQSMQAKQFDDVAEIVPLLRTGVEESYQDVRELLHNFRTRLEQGNLVASLETTIDKFQRQSGIEVELIADGDGPPFPREQQLQLLFIVQEALSNVRKHAQATRVEVRLQDQQDFVLSISDDGAGFDPDSVPGQGETHVGIHIMRERAQRIHAQLGVSSTIGGGTTITLRLPRAQRRAA